MRIRPAEASETAVLARLWDDGWQDAHAAILPAALARARTLESFAERIEASLDDVRTTGPIGAPLGFTMLKGDELNQLYVSAKAYGTRVAAALIADAEARLLHRGVATAWLHCAIGNLRAARFYEKSGWRRAGTVACRLDTAQGPFDIDIWRYEKRLASIDRG
jgi:GNAT superfamily N-acetyltransferase